MYKRILVPVDGSNTATLGLKEAIKLAQDQHAQIRIMHVVDEIAAVTPALYGSVHDRIIQHFLSTGAAVLKTAQALASEAGVATVDTQLVEAMGGPAGDHVVRIAIEWPADLIVCGTHGRRGLRRIIMGSDAEYILRHSPVPVLFVRSGEADD